MQDGMQEELALLDVCHADVLALLLPASTAASGCRASEGNVRQLQQQLAVANANPVKPLSVRL